MRYGASTVIWISPFSNKTLDLLDKAKAFGFDILEICVEDPDALDPALVRAHANKADMALTICGAFGPSRDLSSEDGAVRRNGLAYLKRCVDFAAALGSPVVSGPIYAAVCATRVSARPNGRAPSQASRRPRLMQPSDRSSLRSSP